MAWEADAVTVLEGVRACVAVGICVEESVSAWLGEPVPVFESEADGVCVAVGLPLWLRVGAPDRVTACEGDADPLGVARCEGVALGGAVAACEADSFSGSLVLVAATAVPAVGCPAPTCWQHASHSSSQYSFASEFVVGPFLW